MDETIRPIAVLASLGTAAFGWLMVRAGTGVVGARIAGGISGAVVWASWLRGSEPSNSDPWGPDLA